MLYLACDHAGLKLKDKIKKFLTYHQIEFVDLGTNSQTRVDASDYAVKAARRLKADKQGRAILICGSGIMMSMAANRFPHLRAALAWTPEIARQAREHNNANVLVLSGRESVPHQWPTIIQTFLQTKFSKEKRYGRRIKKLSKINHL